MQADWR